jgi:hypothetical protein
MSNKRDLKAYVRYDGSGRAVPGGLILNRFKPGMGNWSEINAYECCNGPVPSSFVLRLTFNSIENASILVGDASNLSDWNTFFDLPTLGNSFTSVEIDGTTVVLYGASDITVKDYLFQANNNLLQIVDTGAIIAGGKMSFYNCDELTLITLPNCKSLPFSVEDDYGCFENCGNLVEVNLDTIEVIEDSCFYACISLTTVYAPLLKTVTPTNIYGSFASCESLINIDFPSLQTAGDESFNQCYAATTVNLPNLTTIGDRCFVNAQSLINLSLPSLISAGYGAFSFSFILSTIDLPNLTTLGANAMQLCGDLQVINLPSCTDLGGTVGDDSVFLTVIGSTITLTVPSALMTCNAGNPDGDIQYLQANNTVTIVTV